MVHGDRGAKCGGSTPKRPSLLFARPHRRIVMHRTGTNNDIGNPSLHVLQKHSANLQWEKTPLKYTNMPTMGKSGATLSFLHRSIAG
jgi:hypothetical protein